MMRCVVPVAAIWLLACGLFKPASAIDFYFEPDTTTGDVGQTVWLSGQIGPSQLMRGFTVYMAYDTNVIDLIQAPQAGSLIANHSGLQFNFFDHAPFAPDRLEVGATIFGTDFWQGPGELFRLRFILRQCGDEPIVAPFPPFFVAADNTYPTVDYHVALVSVCPRIPAVAQALTIYSMAPDQVSLRWFAVRTDTLGRPLGGPVSYLVFRQQIVPDLLPPVNIAVSPDTFFIDGLEAGISCNYYVIAQTGP